MAKNLCYVLLIACLLSFECVKKEQIRPVQKIKIMMDTFVRISVYDNSKSTADILAAIDKAFFEISRIDSIANNRNNESNITQLNDNASFNEIEMCSELSEVINTAQKISEFSNGAFDITTFPLIKLWNFTDSTNNIPSDEEIKNALKLVNYRYININEDKIKFSKKDVEIDLGGIAKGYAVDKGMEVLVKNGITDALINAGGDFRAICSSLTKGKRKVWIKHPRENRDATASNQFYGYFKMDNGSVATSGDYERFFVVDSVRYHHILNPKTGYPARKSISVTIQANSAILADALATAIFILGPHEGMELINNLENTEGLIIYETSDGLNHTFSKGLNEKFVKM